MGTRRRVVTKEQSIDIIVKQSNKIHSCDITHSDGGGGDDGGDDGNSGDDGWQAAADEIKALVQQFFATLETLSVVQLKSFEGFWKGTIYQWKTFTLL